MIKYFDDPAINAAQKLERLQWFKEQEYLKSKESHHSELVDPKYVYFLGFSFC